MKQHRFLRDAYKDGAVQYRAGETYPATEQTAVYVAQGVAEVVKKSRAGVDAGGTIVSTGTNASETLIVSGADGEGSVATGSTAE